MSDLAFEDLNGIPKVDFRANLQTAIAAGRRMTTILAEIVRLRRSAGKLTPNEYFYFRLWEERFQPNDKSCFVGKQAQYPMHMACNNTGWFAVAADKLLFQTTMTGAGLPVPSLLAIIHPQRSAPGRTHPERPRTCVVPTGRRQLPDVHKPIDGKYSLSVYSPYAYDKTRTAFS